MAEPALGLDVAIFGGGIAGLWLLASLRAAGYSAALLDSGALGQGQSAASQGIIHGGVKYTLNLDVGAAARALGEMPAIWREALAGRAGPDLAAARIAAEHHHMWVPRQFAGGLMRFFASRAMRGRVEVLAEGRPAPFDDPAFDGELMALDELVLDVPSVLAALAAQQAPLIRRINWPDGIEFARDGDGRVREIAAGPLTMQPTTVVCTAGAGNRAIARRLGIEAPIDQRRPLRMVMIKGAPVDLQAHCIAKQTNPRLTVTSHRTGDGERLWYVGGQLAEDGVALEPEELIASARHEFQSLLPWLDLTDAAWSSHQVERVEGLQADRRRPDQPVISGHGNVLFAWPTKLALAPRLAAMLLDELPPPAASGTSDLGRLAQLPAPALAKPPWDEARLWS